MALATVTFYNVRECGYYKRGTRELAFGSIEETLDSMLRWVDPGVKPLLETCTHVPPAGSDVLRTFCLGMRKSLVGDFVIAAWNESHNTEGQVAHVDVSQTVGNAAVEVAELGVNQVPGFPSYFWFIPASGLVANIRFESQRLTGTAAMWGHLRMFLTLHGPGCCFGDREDDADHVIVGYAENDQDEPLPLIPSFQTVQRQRPRAIDEIRLKRTAIRKMIRKTLICGQHPADVGQWRSFMQGLGLGDTPAPVDAIRAKYEIPFTPSADQFEEVIRNWRNDINDEWNDVGFQFHGDTKVSWLGTGIGRFEEELEVIGDDQNVVSAASLMSAISAKRDRLLALAG